MIHTLLVIVLVWIIGSAFYENSLRKRIKKLKVKIETLEKLHIKTVEKEVFAFNEENSVEQQLNLLEFRVKKLISCCRCPLYQDKDQQGKQ